MNGQIILAVVVSIVFTFGVVFLLYWFTKKGDKTEEVEKPIDQSFMLIQQQLQELRSSLDSKIGESSKMMQDSVSRQFSESQSLIKNITEEITQVKETNKQVFGITEQLQNLEKVLKNQKQRGNLGEAGLELILNNVLPPTAYKLQHRFDNGDAVDAAILTKDGIIPIDAKFSLDNYNRVINEDNEVQREVLEKEFKNDLKKRIDETAKYIRPSEGTLPFALMYIPAEGIYYDLLVNEVGALKVNTRNLIDYAHNEKKVIIVSPTTFVAYLHTILQGFRAFKVEESAKAIASHVEALGRHIKSYEDYHKKLGNALSTTVNHFNSSNKELRKIDKDVLRITGSSSEIETLALDKPVKEDED